MRYYFYNANSHNNFIDDCFPRAYSIVMDITWKEAYKELCKSAMEQGYMMDSAIFVRNFLNKKFRRISYNEKYIGEFAENHPYLSTGINITGDITPITLATVPLSRANTIE